MENTKRLQYWDSLIEEISPELKNLISDFLDPMLPFETGQEININAEHNIKAVLFDIYGTLLVSGTGDIGVAREKDNIFSCEELFVKAGITNQAPNLSRQVSELFFSLIEKDHQEKKAQGISFPEVNILSIWKDILRELSSLSMIKWNRDPYKLIRLSVMYELVTNPVWLMPGAESVLSALRGKFPLGIVSNAQFYTPITVESLSGKELKELGFRSELCSWSYRLEEAKPSRSLFEQPLSILADEGISPDQVLYVGNDMLNDIYTASQHGCRTALFAGDKRSLRLRKDKDVCRKLKPDYVITDLAQLITLL